MNTAHLVRSLAEQSEELSRDLDSFSDRAFELTRLAKALKERAGRQYAEKATQVETTAVGAPVFHLDRAKRMAPFAFQPMDRKLNWRKLRALNVDRVIQETDTRSVLELYGEVAYADLEKESVYDLSEANLLKLVKVMQLLLQCQQFQLDQGRDVQQLLREDAANALALVSMLPHLEMKPLEDGLKKLQGEFYKVADADMDAMFQQVRTEERTGARDTLATNVDQVKQVLDIKVFGTGQGGATDPSRASGAIASGRASARIPAAQSSYIGSRPPSIANLSGLAGGGGGVSRSSSLANLGGAGGGAGIMGRTPSLGNMNGPGGGGPGVPRASSIGNLNGAGDGGGGGGMGRTPSLGNINGPGTGA